MAASLPAMLWFGLRAARLHPLAPLVRLGIRMTFPWLPVERLFEDHRVVAFHHPRPAYPVHVLVVPRNGAGSLLSAAADEALLGALLAAARRVVQELRLESGGYRVVINGGPNQDVPVLHLHVIAGAASD